MGLSVVTNKATHLKNSVPNITVYYTESNDSHYENEGTEAILLWQYFIYGQKYL